MAVSDYYVLVDLPTERHKSDLPFIEQSRVPVAVLRDFIRSREGRLRDRLKVLINGRETTIRPDQVVVSRVHLPEFDPFLNPNYSHETAPFVLPMPDSLRQQLDKARIRDVLLKNAPHVPQPRYSSVYFSGRNVEDRSTASIGRVEDSVRQGGVYWLKPTNGLGGKAIVRISSEDGRLVYHTDDPVLKQQIRSSVRPGLPLKDFIEREYIPHVGSVFDSRRLMLEENISGERVIRTRQGRQVAVPSEFRFSILKTGKRPRVTAMYSKLGGGGITGNRAQSADNAQLADTVPRIVSEIYHNHFPQYSQTQIDALTRQFVDEARTMAESAATAYYREAQRVLAEQRKQGRPYSTTVREFSVDFMPVMKYQDSGTSGLKEKKLVPVLLEVNSQRVGFEGLRESDAAAHEKHMEARMQVLEDLWRKGVSQRVAATPSAMIARRRHLDSLFDLVSDVSLFSQNGATADSVHQITFKPRAGHAADVRMILERLGVNVEGAIHPEPGRQKEYLLHVARSRNAELPRNFDWLADNLMAHSERLALSAPHRAAPNARRGFKEGIRA